MAPLALLKNFKVIVFCTFVAFGGFLFGYDIGVLSGLLIQRDFIRRFGEIGPDGEYFLSPSRQSIITSLLSAGTFVGSLAQALTSDRFGRKGSIFFWSAVFTVGVAIQTSSVSGLAQITVGRFIAGLGVGAMSAIVPLYNGEAAPKALRGFLLVMYQVQIIFGIFCSYVLDIAVSHLNTPVAWQLPIGLQLLFGVVLMAGILYLPESPRLLLSRGNIEGARDAIRRLNNCPIDDPLVQEEIDDLSYGIKVENEGGKAGWLECFSTRNALWKRTINGMMLQFIQQLNGQNFYYYYGPTFFEPAGTNLTSLEVQLMLGGVSLIATLPALWALDKIGRRKMLFQGAILEAICAIIAGLVGHFLLPKPGTPKDLYTSSNKTGGAVLVAFAVLQIMCFSFFWGPTPWVYLGESFPLRVRAKCIALGTATNWFWNFLLSFFAPRIAQKIGPLILLIFAGVLIFGAFYVYFFIPETKGLSLEEVDQMYRENVKPWKSTEWTPAIRPTQSWTDDKGEIHHVSRAKAPDVFH